MAGFGKRPQQYRVKWPLTPAQVENIDTMFETLFKRIDATQKSITEASSTATQAVALATGLIGDGDRDGNEFGVLSAPGPTGPQGLIGATGPTMLMPPEAAEEQPLIVLPGPQGPQGPSVTPIALFDDMPAWEDAEIRPPGVPVEAGSWTPVDASGAGLSFTSTFPALYRRQGDLVFATVDVTYPATADTSAASIGGFPYTSGPAQFAMYLGYTDRGGDFLIFVQASSTFCFMFTFTGVQLKNSDFSGKTIRASAAYFVA